MSTWRSQAGGPFTTAFEMAPEAIVVTDGEEHRITAANAAARELLGEDAEGRRVPEVLPGLGADAYDAWAEALRTGEPRHGRGWCVVGDPGGPERWYDARLAPWHDPDGRARGVVAHLVDVTDRMQHRDLSPAREHEATTALQEMVLPQDLPVVPGLELAAAYLLADATVGAGGDWFDAVPGPDAVSLVVGDVVGRGLAAAAAMSAVRAVLRERLAAGEDPGTAVRAVDAFVRAFPEAVGATVCVARVEHGTGRLSYCTAGHPTPLVAAPDGTAYFLPRSGASPLGTGARFATAEHRLEPGEMLVLYTDGAVERPSRTASQNTLDLAGLVSRAITAPRESERALAGTLCDDVLARLVRHTGSGDDIALLAAQRVPAPGPLRLTVPGESGAARTVRLALADWLAPLAVRDLDEMAVQHAVGELVANAVVHGSPLDDEPAEVDVEAHLGRDGRLVVRVADRGQWIEPPIGHRGRGLGLTRGFAERVTIDRGLEGTTVTLELPVSRSAQLYENGGARGEARRALSATDELEVLDAGPDLLLVRGAVDIDSAEHLHSALLRLSVGGTAPLTVDLSGVGFLGSVGVRVLFEALDWEHDESAGLTLIAAPGTPAQHVLETVGLPYRSALTDDDLPPL